MNQIQFRSEKRKQREKEFCFNIVLEKYVEIASIDVKLHISHIDQGRVMILSSTGSVRVINESLRVARAVQSLRARLPCIVSTTAAFSQTQRPL